MMNNYAILEFGNDFFHVQKFGEKSSRNHGLERPFTLECSIAPTLEEKISISLVFMNAISL